MRAVTRASMAAVSAGSLQPAMAAAWARRAEEQELHFARPERQQDLRILRSFVQETFAGRDVLEVACGTGSWTQILSRSAASVTALDLDDEAVEIARARPRMGENVDFWCADAYALPSFPRRFSGGLAAFWWSRVPKARLRPFLAGLHLAFAPGATVVFIDHAVHRAAPPEAHAVSPSEEELRQTLDGLATNVRVGFLPHFWVLTYTPRVEG
jgi:SAM-dependent methyltransferase